MNDISIRNAVQNNLKGLDASSIRSTIEDAINLNEDKVLPGLGVMFESLWKKATEQDKQVIINYLITK